MGLNVRGYWRAVAGIAWMWLTLCSAAHCATFYIDPTASPPGNGSQSTPFTNWSQMPIAAGNSYLQRAGTTAIGTINVQVPGTSGSPIYIGSYGAGPTPILQGQVIFKSTAYATVENFEVRNAEGPGVGILTDCENVTIRGLKIYHCATGVTIAADARGDNLIVSCTIYENDSTGVAIQGGQTSAGYRTTIQGNSIYRNGLHGVQIHGNYYVVEGNEIHTNGLSGIPGTSGVHIYSESLGEGSGDNNIVRNNRISHQQDFDGFDGNGVQSDHYCDNNEISDNVIFENDGGGVFIHDAQNCTVLRNTLYGNMRDRGSTRQELGEIDLTSKSTAIDRVTNNTILDNVVVAVNPAATSVLVDSETKDSNNAFGNNGFYHEASGDLWRVDSESGTDMNVWNTFASGDGDDYAFDPVSAGFVPPAEPPAFMLDTSFTVHSSIFQNAVPDAVNVLLGGPGNDTITGGTLSDTLVGNGGNDTISGGPGNDWVVGGADNDTLNGNDGADFIVGGLGDDTMDGGAGDDSLSGGAGVDTMYGGTGIDLLLGATGNDQLYGGDGGDTLQGGAGDDRLEGGLGNDLDFGGDGDDTIDESGDTSCGMNSIFGEAGNDTLTGGCGIDAITGGAGADVMYGGDGDDTLDEHGDTTAKNELHGGAGNDALTAGDLGDTMYGDAGNDIVVGGAGGDTIDERSDPDGLDILIGNGGNDTIYGGGGPDQISGVDGDDMIDGGPGGDTIDGGPGANTLVGGLGFDIIAGGNDNDLIDESADTGAEGNLLFGNGGDDIILGGLGPDVIYGNNGHDTITAGAGENRVFGGNGDDTITTGSGNDFISGGNGADQIDAGGSNDIIAGGAGNDTINGEAGDDAIDGGDGDDIIDGEEGFNIIIGGAGDDRMTGGSSTDNFTFDSGSGSDAITNFGVDDVLVVTKGVNGTPITTTQDLWNRMTNTVNGVMLDLGSGNTVLLEGITLASLDRDRNLLMRDPVDVPQRTRMLSVPESTQTAENAVVEIPVSIDEGDGVASIDFQMVFNPGVMTFLDYSRGPLLADWGTLVVSSTGGTVSLHAMDAGPLDSGGQLVTLRFQVKSDPEAVLTLLSFTNTELNGGAIPSQSSDGTITLGTDPPVPLDGESQAMLAIVLAVCALARVRRQSTR